MLLPFDAMLGHPTRALTTACLLAAACRPTAAPVRDDPSAAAHTPPTPTVAPAPQPPRKAPPAVPPPAFTLTPPEPSEIDGRPLHARTCTFPPEHWPRADDVQATIRAVAGSPAGLLVVDHANRLLRFRLQDDEPCAFELDRTFGRHGAVQLQPDGTETIGDVTVTAQGTFVSGPVGAVFRLSEDAVPEPWCDEQIGFGRVASLADAGLFVGGLVDGRSGVFVHEGEPCRFERLPIPEAHKLQGVAHGMLFTADGPRMVRRAPSGKVLGPLDDDVLANDVFECGPWVCVVETGLLTSRWLHAWSRDGRPLGTFDLGRLSGTEIWPTAGFVLDGRLFVSGAAPTDDRFAAIIVEIVGVP